MIREKPVLPRRRILAGLAATAAGLDSAPLALAQPAAGAWPNRPLRIVVPYAAGGSTDILTRLLAQRLRENLGQAVVVENHGGGPGAASGRPPSRPPTSTTTSS